MQAKCLFRTEFTYETVSGGTESNPCTSQERLCPNTERTRHKRMRLELLTDCALARCRRAVVLFGTKLAFILFAFITAAVIAPIVIPSVIISGVLITCGVTAIIVVHVFAFVV